MSTVGAQQGRGVHHALTRDEREVSAVQKSPFLPCREHDGADADVADEERQDDQDGHTPLLGPSTSLRSVDRYDDRVTRHSHRLELFS